MDLPVVSHFQHRNVQYTKVFVGLFEWLTGFVFDFSKYLNLVPTYFEKQVQ